ncbi:PREDICTED: uncharacterized protein LOC104599401 isoform X2 [Nelumbo nucifera]|uniref:Uncharacterized protein LOC104599401 isoform X2 n=2 Tax=Nelumbo nucifera TaxID=4432 RepID=A0A1U8AEL1_NELNU|nr:PREDICTED: uncharacterized protein LOC104599401 isoform X2 [Nelumbo nucifera]DAD35062.1 TPA_asm: hypothetical protein HUJ06_005702 [Nelumbo nucifera]
MTMKEVSITKKIPKEKIKRKKRSNEFEDENLAQHYALKQTSHGDTAEHLEQCGMVQKGKKKNKKKIHDVHETNDVNQKPQEGGSLVRREKLHSVPQHIELGQDSLEENTMEVLQGKRNMQLVLQTSENHVEVSGGQKKRRDKKKSDENPSLHVKESLEVSLRTVDGEKEANKTWKKPKSKKKIPNFSESNDSNQNILEDSSLDLKGQWIKEEAVTVFQTREDRREMFATQKDIKKRRKKSNDAENGNLHQNPFQDYTLHLPVKQNNDMHQNPLEDHEKGNNVERKSKKKRHGSPQSNILDQKHLEEIMRELLTPVKPVAAPKATENDQLDTEERKMKKNSSKYPEDSNLDKNLLEEDHLEMPIKRNLEATFYRTENREEVGMINTRTKRKNKGYSAPSNKDLKSNKMGNRIKEQEWLITNPETTLQIEEYHTECNGAKSKIKRKKSSGILAKTDLLQDPIEKGGQELLVRGDMESVLCRRENHEGIVILEKGRQGTMSSNSLENKLLEECSLKLLEVGTHQKKKEWKKKVDGQKLPETCSPHESKVESFEHFEKARFDCCLEEARMDSVGRKEHGVLMDGSLALKKCSGPSKGADDNSTKKISTLINGSSSPVLSVQAYKKQKGKLFGSSGDGLKPEREDYLSSSLQIIQTSMRDVVVGCSDGALALEKSKSKIKRKKGKEIAKGDDTLISAPSSEECLEQKNVIEFKNVQQKASEVRIYMERSLEECSPISVSINCLDTPATLVNSLEVNKSGKSIDGGDASNDVYTLSHFDECLVQKRNDELRELQKAVREVDPYGQHDMEELEKKFGSSSNKSGTIDKEEGLCTSLQIMQNLQMRDATASDDQSLEKKFGSSSKKLGTIDKEEGLCTSLQIMQNPQMKDATASDDQSLEKKFGSSSNKSRTIDKVEGLCTSLQIMQNLQIRDATASDDRLEKKFGSSSNKLGTIDKEEGLSTSLQIMQNLQMKDAITSDDQSLEKKFGSSSNKSGAIDKEEGLFTSLQIMQNLQMKDATASDDQSLEKKFGSSSSKSGAIDKEEGLCTSLQIMQNLPYQVENHGEPNSREFSEEFLDLADNVSVNNPDITIALKKCIRGTDRTMEQDIYEENDLVISRFSISAVKPEDTTKEDLCVQDWVHYHSTKQLEQKKEELGRAVKECYKTKEEDVEASPRDGKEDEMVLSPPTTNALMDVPIGEMQREDKPIERFLTSLEREPVSCRRKLLILDMNGLLADIVCFVPPGYTAYTRVGKKAVFKRPFCDDFLKFCFERFDVGVWSSRAKQNLDVVVCHLMGDMRHNLLFCWDQSHCTATGFTTVGNEKKPLVLKELKKLWNKCVPGLSWNMGEYNESNTLLLDDSPYKALLNPPYTSVFPHSYSFRDEKDNSLGPGGDLRVYLEGLAVATDVQNYVKQHPFGQRALTNSNPSWRFYRRVVDAVLSKRLKK